MTTPAKFNDKRPLLFHQAYTDTCAVDIHIHDTYEIFQALSDNIRYYVEGNAYDLSPGDIIITSSREIHRPVTVNQDPYGRRLIQFDPAMIQAFMAINYNPLHIFENRRLGHNNLIVIPQHATSVVNRYFSTIEASLISALPRNHYEGWMALHNFLIELELLHESSEYDETTIQPIDSGVLNVKNYLDHHYTEPFKLDAISRMYLIDKFHLSRIFKEATGFTLVEYIQSKRIRHAKTLLAGKLTILEISQQCGYEDYTNFYKTFKKMTKLSPKAYRATLLECTLDLLSPHSHV